MSGSSVMFASPPWAASIGTALGPCTASTISSQVDCLTRTSSSNSFKGVGGATSSRVFSALRKRQRPDVQASRSVKPSRTCSCTKASTTSCSTKPRWTSSSPRRQPWSSVRCASNASARFSGTRALLEISRAPELRALPWHRDGVDESGLEVDQRFAAVVVNDMQAASRLLGREASQGRFRLG